MTDEQIIEALAYCVSTKSCEECPICNTDNCGFVLMRNAFDLIERQQVEIEDLKADKEAIVNGQLTIQKMYIEARDKAVREFAERLTDIICEKIEKSMSNSNGNDYFITDVYTDIDNLVREMTEEEGGKG